MQHLWFLYTFVNLYYCLLSEFDSVYTAMSLRLDFSEISNKMEQVSAIELLYAKSQLLKYFLVKENQRFSLGGIQLAQVLNLLKPLQKQYEVVVLHLWHLGIVKIPGIFHTQQSVYMSIIVMHL